MTLRDRAKSLGLVLEETPDRLYLTTKMSGLGLATIRDFTANYELGLTSTGEPCYIVEYPDSYEKETF